MTDWELPYPGLVVTTTAAHSGEYGIKMDGRGRMDYTFETVPGETYQVSAWLRIDQVITAPTWGGLRLEVVDIPTWSQLARSDYLNTGSHPFGQTVPLGEWVKVEFSFVAISEQSRWVYSNFSNGDFEASADEFMVKSVPGARERRGLVMAEAGLAEQELAVELGQRKMNLALAVVLGIQFPTRELLTIYLPLVLQRVGDLGRKTK